jgi:Uncharacterised protein family (UPF0158)
MRRDEPDSCKARLRRNSRLESQYNRHDMATEVNLDAIIEALDMANDSLSSYLDVETGEVRSITEEEFDLAEDPQTDTEDLPDWQREAIELARNVQQQEGKRYLALPDKFDVHEWAIMDRFSETLKDAQMRNDFHGGIRGPGAFRLFKHLLTEYNLWDAWNRFKQVELRQIAIEWCEENRITFRQA